MGFDRRSLSGATVLGFAAACCTLWAAGQEPTEGTTARLTARANLVVVNVTVKDRGGKPIHGLKLSDFYITEAKMPQQVRSFEEHQAKPASKLQPEPPLKLPAGFFTNYTPVPTGGALDVLLVDRLNTPLDAQTDLHRQLDEYLASAPANHQVAVFGLNSRLTMLQGFTGSPATLREALKRASIQNSVAMENPASNEPALHLSDVKQTESGSPDGQYAGTSTNSARDPEGDGLRTFETRVALFETEARIRMTLSALEALADYLAPFPGRKNVIWFTGSFPTYMAANATITDTFAGSADLNALLTNSLNKMARAQVAVFPVDARGLMVVPQYDPSARGNTDPQQFSTQLAAFNGKAADEHITMEQTAHETGGQAFFNTNGLKQALAKVVSSGDDYYSLSYVPSDAPKPGIYHAIEVTIVGPSAVTKPVLEYRRGYFGSSNEKQTGYQAGDLKAGKPAASPTLTLMSHGAPDASQILLKVHAQPVVAAETPAEEDPAPSTHVAPGAKGPWRRYVIDVAVPPSQVLGSVENGNAPADVELVLLCFDQDGKPVTSASGNVRLHVPQANLQKLQAEGLRLRQAISVPDKGHFYLRVGVHNLLDNSLGTVEIPLDSVRSLSPAA